MMIRQAFHTQRRNKLCLCPLLALALLFPFSSLADDATRIEMGPMVVYSMQGSFDEAKDALNDSIANQGLVLSNELHASDMLNRTAPDLGITENVYIQASTFEFCSSLLSHTLVAKNPANMMVCPYAIGLYVLTKDPATIHMAYRNPQGTPGSKETTVKIRNLLETIISEALDFL